MWWYQHLALGLVGRGPFAWWKMWWHWHLVLGLVGGGLFVTLCHHKVWIWWNNVVALASGTCGIRVIARSTQQNNFMAVSPTNVSHMK